MKTRFDDDSPTLGDIAEGILSVVVLALGLIFFLIVALLF
jgi:hypothetical protein